MRMTTFKKILLTMLGLGVVSSLVSVGTFGFFQATTTNNGNTFTAGTLLMTNSQGTGATCTAVSSNSSCNTLLGLNVTTPGTLEPSSSASGTVTITNSGTLGSSGVTVYFANLAGAGNSTANQCDGTCAATGLKAVLNATLHDDTTNTCLYGTVSTVQVTQNPAKGNGACDSIASAITTITANAFSSLPASTAAITIPSSAGTATAGCTTAAACLAWASTEAHNFTLTLQFPKTTSNQNTYQGANASFDAVWTAAQ